MDDTFLELSSEELAVIGNLAGVEIPPKGEVSFFHKIGGKIILGLLGTLILYGIYSSYFGKDEEEKKVEIDKAE